MLTVLLLPILLGMTALAVDIGSYASERRTLQNAADAIALAAGKELPDSSAATAAANTWAANNNIDTAGMTISITGGNTAPRVQITLNSSHEFAFIKALGVDDKDVGATATAGLFTQAGGTGVVPWSIEQATVDAATSGAEVVIKYDANGAATGNFGAIAIDGSGSSDYEDGAMYGATTSICSTAMPGCTAANCPSGSCPESAPECDGPECSPKTGNMTGPTRDAVDFRMDNTDTACDTFDEVFTPVSTSLAPAIAADLMARYQGEAGGGAGRAGVSFARSFAKKTATPTPTSTPIPTHTSTSTPTNTPVPPTATSTTGPATATNTPPATNTPGPSPTPTNTSVATPTYTPVSSQQQYALDGECNPWSGGACTSTSDQCSRRVFLIPIIDGFGNGSSDPLTVLGFALMFLEGYDSGKCTGNTCEIKARFVKAELTTNFSGDTYDPNSLLSFVKLVE